MRDGRGRGDETGSRGERVPSDSDLLFGKLAVRMGLCTEPALAGCVVLQGNGPDRLPLGRVLVNAGFLTEEQYSQIIAAQQRNLSAVDPLLKKRREAVLFGKLAVREGLLDAAQANECLAQQGAPGEKRSLGEIMVAKGFLTVTHVRNLLAKQQKRIMNCGLCNLSFTVLSISSGNKVVACPRCKMPLEEGPASASTATDAEFATQVMLAAKHEVPPAARQETRIMSKDAVVITTRCVVCDQKLKGVLDSTGRLRCPTCLSTFVPKRE